MLTAWIITPVGRHEQVSSAYGEAWGGVRQPERPSSQPSEEEDGVTSTPPSGQEVSRWEEEQEGVVGWAGAGIGV